MKHQALYLFLLASFMLACNEDNKPILDEEAPVITILSPEDGAIFDSGTSILLKADISENLELHEYSAVLRSSDGEVALTIAAGHAHDKALTIEESVELPNLENKEFTLTIKANDHEDNLGSSAVDFYTN